MSQYQLYINGIPVPVNRWSGPGALRSGYRGPEPGSREAGSASFDLYSLTGADPFFREAIPGARVDIHRLGRPFYRGIIGFPAERTTYTSHIQSKESASALNDVQAGSMLIGPWQNPELYGFYIEGPAYGYEARIAAAFADDPRSYIGFTKEFRFDSYHWVPRWPAREGEAVRSLRWDELTPDEIAQRVMDTANSQGTTWISRVELGEVVGPEQVTSRVIQDTAGEFVHFEWIAREPELGYFNLHGLITRQIDGRDHTFLWLVRGGTFYLYQLVNHGVAVRLGKHDFSTDYVRDGFEPWFLPFGNTVKSFGPIAIPHDTHNWQGSHFLSFYLYGQLPTRYQRWEVWQIDLRSILSAETDGDLPVTVYRNQGQLAAIQPFMRGSEGVYNLSTTPYPIRSTVSERSGGRYLDSGNETVSWIGDLFLREMAIDFRGVTLRDVLRDVSICCGAEWWIDADGTLRMTRLDQGSGSSHVRSSRVLSDVQIEQDLTPFEDLGLSGIPLNDTHAIYLLGGLRDLSRYQASVRRTTFIPAGGIDLPLLGRSILLDDVPRGRLVAIEASGEQVTIETELESDREETPR
jgi:hypothetical protein